MRLEVESIAVEGLDFGSQTALRDHTLLVDRDAVRRLVLEDPRFVDVGVHVARPGESVRIMHAMDVAEPRWKVDGPGGVFPGLVSPATAVGTGRTRRLARVAVISVGEPVPGEQIHFREQIVDMDGPGAPLSPFGDTLNLVLDFQPNLAQFPTDAPPLKDVLAGTPSAVEYNHAIQRAGLRVAAYLGAAVATAAADDVEVFDLAPCDPSLVKVACLYHCHRPYVYGTPVGLPVGTVVHPNECFDGALVGWQQGRRCTYWDQNNPVMVELCRRHGTDLSFQGSILFGDTSPSRVDKERIASTAARLAGLLGAEAAVLLGVNGSNHCVDAMLAVQACEQAGIKTTLLLFDVGNGRDDPGFIFAVPEADAIVCTGSRDWRVTLPPIRTVIGGDRLVDPELTITGQVIDASGELNVPLRYLHSAYSVDGHSRLTTRFH
jgi:glycine reductase complex component B subunit alpha and beta